jgi:prepilin-type N-terminal cleavage/methylation domain-containing protein
MKVNVRGRKLERAMTLLEVLIVIMVIGLLVALLLPSLARPGPRYRMTCVNNLKQIGLSFRQWALDNNGRFPMNVSVTNGGSEEFVSRGGVFAHFMVLADELNTPRILRCPQDTTHTNATSFKTNFTEANISYFIGVDATQTHPAMFLTGDRNLTNGSPSSRGVLLLTTNSVVGWTEKIHVHQGNVGLADGSVMVWNNTYLQQAVASTGVATNRLNMPWY